MRIPLLERVDRMSLLSIPIDLKVANAYSKGGIPLRVHAIANVKVSSDPRVVGNAIERFLGRDPAEIARVAKESLEGHLRGVLANLRARRLTRCALVRCDVEDAGGARTLHATSLVGLGALGRVPADLARWHRALPRLHRLLARALGIERLTRLGASPNSARPCAASRSSPTTSSFWSGAQNTGSGENQLSTSASRSACTRRNERKNGSPSASSGSSEFP